MIFVFLCEFEENILSIFFSSLNCCKYNKTAIDTQVVDDLFNLVRCYDFAIFFFAEVKNTYSEVNAKPQLFAFHRDF